MENEAGELELLADYAAVSAIKKFRRGEGLVGQAAQNSQLSVLEDPPSDYYLRVRSGLGESPPKALILTPLLYLGKITAVLELALLKPRSAALEEFLLSVRNTLAVALDLAKTRKARRALLLETQKQADRLRGQEEELRANNDELQAQQAELRAVNEELLRGTDELENNTRYWRSATEIWRQRGKSCKKKRASWRR